MLLQLDGNIVEVKSYERSFEDTPELQAIIILHLAHWETGELSKVNVYPSSPYWPFFLYCIQNPSTCPAALQTSVKGLL